MSKRTLGLMAGAVLAVGASLSLVVALGVGSSPAQSGALAAGASAQPTNSAVIGGAEIGGKDGGQLAKAAATTKTSGVVKAKAVKKVRSISLTLPATANVGANVTGSILVIDTAGDVVTPIEGAAVALQQKRGAVFVTIADGVTDETGSFPVAFTSKVTSSWRAQLTPVTGAKLYSATKTTAASATVTWASRPDMDVVHGVAASYSFRVSPIPGSVGHLEIANSKTPTKWIPLKGVVVPSTGVLAQSETFPTAGTWLLRGSTAATATHGVGYTSVLTITVS
jgi:hypothetical protein